MAGRQPSPSGGVSPWELANRIIADNNALGRQAMAGAQKTTDTMHAIEAGRQDDLFKAEVKNGQQQRRYGSKGKGKGKGGMPNPLSSLTERGFPEELIVRPSMMDMPGMTEYLMDNYTVMGNSNDRYNSMIYKFDPAKSAASAARMKSVKGGNAIPRTMSEAESVVEDALENGEE